MTVANKLTLRDISSLHGSLESATRFIAWTRPYFFHVQNVIRQTLALRYHILRRSYAAKGREDSLRRELTPQLMHRLCSLIAQEKAAFLWNKNATFTVTTKLRSSLATIRHVLQDSTKKWAQPIGFIVERDAHVITLGDASGTGGGAYCEQPRFWFNITWSEKVTASFNKKPTTDETIHINSHEFIVVILQYAATAVRLEKLPDSVLRHIFPAGVPAQPVMLCRTDNTAAEAWANKVTSKSPQGRRLIGVLAELLRTTNLELNARHIAGTQNVLADFIS
jgi:hypothetical protein